MIKKIFKYLGIGIACLAVVVVSAALLYRKYLQHKVAVERAIHSSNGIDSLEAVRIGGIDQWIEVRGEDVNNPILLFIHGGPGIAFIPLAGSFQGPWEKQFTVVQWDQRGAGKTYTSNSEEVQRRTMNVPQMEQDTLEVVNYLRNRFHREKIFVVGHSWGSILGLWLAHEHPETIYAYVGTGQVVNMEQNEAASYQDALKEAHARHNELAVKELESIAPYPPSKPNFDVTGKERKWSSEFLGPPPGVPDFTDVKRLLTDVISAPEYSLADDYSFIHGQTSLFSVNILLPEMMKVDLSKLGGEFQTSIFFFEGRNDPFCRPSLIWDYAETMKAPKKEFIWFDHSAHFPFFEEEQKFADELAQRVRPLAVSHAEAH
ncbi:MAG: alpha/beta fold hydrolase [Candidatus Acidiferrales bacterium]